MAMIFASVALCHFGTIPACDRQRDRRNETEPQHIPPAKRWTNKNHQVDLPDCLFFLPDCLRGLLPAPFLLSYSVFDFIFFLTFRFWAVR